MALESKPLSGVAVHTNQEIKYFKCSGRLLLGAVLSLSVFAVCAFSASYLRRHHALDQENIIFDADPYYRAFAFAEGWGERSLIHPNLSNYVNPFVRVGERILRPFMPDVAPSELRMRLSLGISPLFAALTTAVIFWLVCHARTDTTKAFSLAAIFGFSMSTVAFGSVPDHFLISAFFCALGFLLMQIDGRLNSRWRIAIWTLLVTAAAGITISNALPLLALFGLAEWLKRSSWIIVARSVLCAGIAVVILTLLSWASLNWAYGDFSSVQADQAYKRNVGRVMFYITDNPLRDFISFPITLGRAFWAGKPDVDRNPPYPNPEIAKYDIAFGYQPPLKQSLLNSAMQLIPGALIVLSLVCGFRQWQEDRRLFILPIAVFILFNWLLHSFWGGGAEIFLFSPHWHFASVLGLVPLAQTCSARAWSLTWLVGAVGVAALNLLVWHDALILLPTLAMH